MESLVSLLVFSIGMLGLGQLQARLWVNSGDIHRTDQAHLIAENVIELHEINTLISWDNELAPTIPAYISSSDFSYEQSVIATDLTATTEVRVFWQPLSGTDSTRLRASFNTSFRAKDARWLSQQN